MIALTKTIDMDEHRCWTCGRHWACEMANSYNASCPFCAQGKIVAAEAAASAAERSARAYKSAAKRARRR